MAKIPPSMGWWPRLLAALWRGIRNEFG